VLASTIGFLGDFDLAEEAVQDAFTIAAERWERDGIPDNAAAWLTVTARHRAIDRMRRERTLARKAQQLQAAALPPTEPEPEPEMEDPTVADERLELIFTCCHPALSAEAQVALTLRALGGLATDEIARAFLVTPEAMKRRLTRAKAKIKATRIPFAVPPDHRLPERLTAVLAVVYLIFNEGYGGRSDLAAEAIRLGRLLGELLPGEPEVCGLEALMLLHDARRAARFDGEELVLLADQDRSLWDARQIASGRSRLDRALALGGRGPYVLQAAIASLQAQDRPDWPQIAMLYAELVRCTGSAIVELNRAVAVAEARGAAAGLAIVEALPESLHAYPYLHSSRAELLRRLGREDESRAAYGRALELTHSRAERRFLSRRLAELELAAGGVDRPALTG
jgi:RNA polymerase sigma-70 factor (ECF subfamily)